MKQEGYDAGKGASRKRTDDGRREEGGDDDGILARGGDNAATEHAEMSEHSRKKRHKSDPLYDARKEAESRKAEKLETIITQEQRLKEEGKKQKERKIRAKKLMQRTKRGQPLIKNVIGDLLAKIKSDVDK